MNYFWTGLICFVAGVAAARLLWNRSISAGKNALKNLGTKAHEEWQGVEQKIKKAL